VGAHRLMRAVALEVFLTLVYPVFEYVTLTVIFFPRCTFAILYVDFVAPLIALPFEYHWYLYFSPAPAAGFAVSFFPTFIVPLIFGAAGFIVPFATVFVALEAFVTVVYPDRVPV